LITHERNPRLTSIKTVNIYSQIGIARVGNSPEDWFIGPERVGEEVAPEGGFKDAMGRMKRQAARFRIFGYDAQGQLVGEVTSADAEIHWTVHLANKKAAWHRFEGLNANTPLRNAGVADRKQLIIDPGSRSLSGPGQVAVFDTGEFIGEKVPLGGFAGRRRTPAGAGGFGHSDFYGKPIHTFANNDGWHDDLSDGPVGGRAKRRRDHHEGSRRGSLLGRPISPGGGRFISRCTTCFFRVP
jgi:hypothetical protein